MELAVICSVAFAASTLTFFTGFGLGTLLLPAFAVFFPTERAVALTAVVHLLNSLFKLVLMGKRASWPEVLAFGVPAVLAAFGGAHLLLWLVDQRPLWSWQAAGRTFRVEPLALVVALLMVGFAALELWPRFRHVAMPRRLMPVGGLLAGFFGGLSGHQGALRSAFLIRAGLDKERFIATGVVIAAVVDVSRLLVYSDRFLVDALARDATTLASAVLAAFAGAVLGRRWLHKVQLRSIEISVAALTLFVALGLGAGVL